VDVDAWRDGTAQWVQNDIDYLVQRITEVARNTLTAGGAWRPALHLMALDGAMSVVLFDGSDGTDTHARMEAMVRRASSGFDLGLAVALATDVRVRATNSGRALHDGIRIEVEHRYGPGLVFLLPYEQKRWRGIQVGNLRLWSAQRVAWAPPTVFVSDMRPRAVMPDAVDDEFLILLKACAQLRLTAEILVTAAAARNARRRLKIVVPAECKLAPDLLAYQTARAAEVVIERVS